MTSLSSINFNFFKDSNYMVDVVMSPKFGNCSVSRRNYHNFNFIKIWPDKMIFLKGGLGSSPII